MDTLKKTLLIGGSSDIGKEIKFQLIDHSIVEINSIDLDLDYDITFYNSLELLDENTSLKISDYKIIKSDTKNQYAKPNIGLNLLLLILDVFITGNNNKTNIALIIATTPPNLSGIDLNIA